MINMQRFCWTSFRSSRLVLCSSPVGSAKPVLHTRFTTANCQSTPLHTSHSSRANHQGVVAASVAFLMGCCLPIGALLLPGKDDGADLEKRLLELGTYDSSLPKPGDLLLQDYRDNDKASQAWIATARGRPVRVVQWNIERGYKFDEIVQTLKILDADVLLLQEIDVGCDRSGQRDVGAELAQELGMHYAFLCEFIELRSPQRDAESQGGGVHGNAILSRLPIASAERIEHSHHPVDWNSDEHTFAKREPRKGRRLTIAATIATPGGPLLVYSAHLEVFSGPIGRLRQFADILDHSRAAAARGVSRHIIGGDLNTMAHGIARFSPYHCTDHLRWATLGQCEAAFWQHHVFDVQGDTSLPADQRRNERLWAAGLQEEAACRSLVNPGFTEVFGIEEHTLDNPRYRVCGVPLMSGKLDWLLHRGALTVADSAIGNHDYSASDHKWLAADFVIGVADDSVPPDR